MNSQINESWDTEEIVPHEYDISSMQGAKWIVTVDEQGFRVVDGKMTNKLVHVFAHRPAFMEVAPQPVVGNVIDH